MPACMVNCIESSVCCPGSRVVDPTTTRGGQHPSTTSGTGGTAKLNRPSPVLLTIKLALTILFMGTSPKSIFDRSRARFGVPSARAVSGSVLLLVCQASRATTARTPTTAIPAQSSHDWGRFLAGGTVGRRVLLWPGPGCRFFEVLKSVLLTARPTCAACPRTVPLICRRGRIALSESPRGYEAADL